MKKIFTLLIGIIFSITILNSQVAPPQAFSLKATIKGSTGQMVPNKTIRLRISILKNNINGTVVYSEYFTPTTDANSQVDLQIGRGTVTSGGFSSINWSTDLYFLKIEVDIRGGTNYQLLSVAQLLSVPYALYAGNANESDPIFKSYPAYGITSSNITNWNTAYSWGNHALAGYVTLTGVQTLTNKTLKSPIINTPTGIVKTDIGLGNVDNTTDLLKPISNATKAALNSKENVLTFNSPLSRSANAISLPAASGSNDGYMSIADKTKLDGLQNADGSQTIVTAGNNINVTGVGTIASPYVINSTVDITGAVTITGDQTIGGNKTIGNDLLVNGLTIGRGGGSISSNTSVGYQALYSNTTGPYNTANGYQALFSNTNGNGNTAIGQAALYSNTTGNLNTANGATALSHNTTGSYNLANGTAALGENTIGSYNIANGSGALAYNTTGNNNTANGVNALAYNTTGNYNSATGYRALFNNTTASSNTADGYAALYSNTTGIGNTANGYAALYSSTTGDNNTADGANALSSNTTGYVNTANGFAALYSNTTGFGNTANGVTVLQNNTSGSQNSAIGYAALNANTIGYGNVANGVEALEYNTSGNYNTANGEEALLNNTSGNYNTADGNYTLTYNTTGSYNTALGFYANVTSSDLTNATAIGYAALVDASNKVVIGNSTVTNIGGYASWTNYSDERLKENIVYKKDLGLNFINKLKTVSYNYKADQLKHRRDGLIAQDVDKVLKDLGLQFSGLVIDDDKDKTMNLSYGDFVIPLINSVQEQQAQIEVQKNQMEAQNKQIEAQQRQIDELKKLVGILSQK